MMLYKFTVITLFSRVTDSVSDLEKSSFNPTLHGLKNSFGMSNAYYKNKCKEEKSIATFHSRRPKLSKSYFVAVAFQAKFSSSTYDKCATVFAMFFIYKTF